ncbi:PQQ-binding-like beta-propeller repeat protein [Actinotalea sp. Marseille-Q4924]|uniref:outer membrane protein assembly factor BamB family protein n=1 Tax=Actinotalea sp. Marseille-Q4924 TaxID=2866571 RepID=UPI001CE40D4C|nr:PQQ-binding-like beta-propeller repeat protein [Actinotalea sp. Marseille-Q4924]
MRRRTDGAPSARPGPQRGTWHPGVATVHDVDVELVEDDEPRSDAGRSTSRHPARSDHGAVLRDRSRRGLVTVTSLAVAGAAVLTLNVATEARSTAAAARLAAVPGVLDPVTGPGPSWTRPDVLLLGVVDDAVLVSSAGHMMEALDARTGEVRWTVGERGTSGWCSLLADDEVDIQFERTTPWSPLGADAACYRSGWWADGPEDDLRRRTLVEIVDTADGRASARLEEDGRLVTSLLLDGDLVLVVARDDGSVVVCRWDPQAAVLRWRTVSDPGVATPDAVGTAVLQDGRTLTVRGNRRATVALADGSPLATHVPATSRRRPTASPVWPLVTDATNPVALLPRREGTRVVAPGAGRSVHELWRVPPGPRPSPVADVSGVVLLAASAEVVAHDRATGRVRWRVETAAAVDPVPLTDGRTVLLPVPGVGTTDLAALDLDDGLEVWRVPLPQGTRMLVPADGAVVVQARDGVVGVPVSP